MRERLPFYIARIRLPLLWAFLGIVVANLFADLPWAWTGLILLVVALACYFVVGTVRREPIDVAPPVTGRWIAVNTPADRVPFAFARFEADGAVRAGVPAGRQAFTVETSGTGESAVRTTA